MRDVVVQTGNCGLLKLSWREGNGQELKVFDGVDGEEGGGGIRGSMEWHMRRWRRR